MAAEDLQTIDILITRTEESIKYLEFEKAECEYKVKEFEVKINSKLQYLQGLKDGKQYLLTTKAPNE